MSAVPGAVRELADADYTRLRRNLLREKGSDRQREFLESVRETSLFLGYVADLPTVGSFDVDLAPYPMTESEFKDPPADTERELYASWSGLTPAVACRSTLWACLTLEHIRKGHLESVYLAANGGNLPGGAERIDFALNDTTFHGTSDNPLILGP